MICGHHRFDNMNPPKKCKCCHHAWAPRNKDYWWMLFLLTFSNTYVSGLDLQVWGIILPTRPYPNKGHVFEVLLRISRTWGPCIIWMAHQDTDMTTIDHFKCADPFFERITLMWMKHVGWREWEMFSPWSKPQGQMRQDYEAWSRTHGLLAHVRVVSFGHIDLISIVIVWWFLSLVKIRTGFKWIE